MKLYNYFNKTSVSSFIFQSNSTFDRCTCFFHYAPYLLCKPQEAKFVSLLRERRLLNFSKLSFKKSQSSLFAVGLSANSKKQPVGFKNTFPFFATRANLVKVLLATHPKAFNFSFLMSLSRTIKSPYANEITKYSSKNNVDFLITELSKKNKEKNYKLLKLKKKIQFLNYTSILKFSDLLKINPSSPLLPEGTLCFTKLPPSYFVTKGKGKQYKYKPVSEVSNLFNFSYTNFYITEKNGGTVPSDRGSPQIGSGSIKKNNLIFALLSKKEQTKGLQSCPFPSFPPYLLRKGRNSAPTEEALRKGRTYFVKKSGYAPKEENLLVLPRVSSASRNTYVVKKEEKQKLKKSLILAIPNLIFSQSSKSFFSSLFLKSFHFPDFVTALDNSPSSGLTLEAQRVTSLPSAIGTELLAKEMGEEKKGAQEKRLGFYEQEKNLSGLFRIGKKKGFPLPLLTSLGKGQKKNAVLREKKNKQVVPFLLKDLQFFSKKNEGFSVNSTIQIPKRQTEQISQLIQFYRIRKKSVKIKERFSFTEGSLIQPQRKSIYNSAYGLTNPFKPAPDISGKRKGPVFFFYWLIPFASLIFHPSSSIIQIPSTNKPFCISPFLISSSASALPYVLKKCYEAERKSFGLSLFCVTDRERSKKGAKKVLGSKRQDKKKILDNKIPFYIQPFYKNKSLFRHKLNIQEPFSQPFKFYSFGFFAPTGVMKKGAEPLGGTPTGRSAGSKQKIFFNDSINQIEINSSFGLVGLDPKTSYLNALFLLENFIKKNTFSNFDNILHFLLSNEFKSEMHTFLPYPLRAPLVEGSRTSVFGPYLLLSLSEGRDKAKKFYEVQGRQKEPLYMGETKYNLVLFNLLFSKEINLYNQENSFLIYFKNLSPIQIPTKKKNLEISFLGSFGDTEKIKKLENRQKFLEKKNPFNTESLLLRRTAGAQSGQIKLNHPLLALSLPSDRERSKATKNKEKTQLNISSSFLLRPYKLRRAQSKPIHFEKLRIIKQNKDKKIQNKKDILKSKKTKPLFRASYLQHKKKSVYKQNKTFKKRRQIYLSKFLSDKKSRQKMIEVKEIQSTSIKNTGAKAKKRRSKKQNYFINNFSLKDKVVDSPNVFYTNFEKSIKPILSTFNSFKKTNSVTESFSQYIYFLVNNASLINWSSSQSEVFPFLASLPSGKRKGQEKEYLNQNSLNHFLPLRQRQRSSSFFVLRSKPKNLLLFFALTKGAPSFGLPYEVSPFLRIASLPKGSALSLLRKGLPKEKQDEQIPYLQSKERDGKNKSIFLEKLIRAYFSNGINKKSINMRLMSQKQDFPQKDITLRKGTSKLIFWKKSPGLSSKKGLKKDSLLVNEKKGVMKRVKPSFLLRNPKRGRSEFKKRRTDNEVSTTFENLRVFLKTKKLFKNPHISVFLQSKNWKTQHFQELKEIFTLKKIKQKKHRKKKLNKQNLSRKKRKRIYPRPIWLRYRTYLSLLRRKNNLLNDFLTINFKFRPNLYAFSRSRTTLQTLLPQFYSSLESKQKVYKLKSDIIETFNYNISSLLKEDLLNKNKNSLIKKKILKTFLKKTEKDFMIIRKKQSENKNLFELSPQKVNALLPLKDNEVGKQLSAAPLVRKAEKKNNIINSNQEYKRILDKRVQKLISLSSALAVSTLSQPVKLSAKRVAAYSSTAPTAQSFDKQKKDSQPSSLLRKEQNPKGLLLSLSVTQKRDKAKGFTDWIGGEGAAKQPLSEPNEGQQNRFYNQEKVKMGVFGNKRKEKNKKYNTEKKKLTSFTKLSPYEVRRAHLKDLFSTEYSQISSQDPQANSLLPKRFKDLKIKSFSQKIWIWLYNNGYTNLCWGSSRQNSFGLNFYELPNKINSIQLSWAFKRSNTVFFAKLANKAKIIYDKNNLSMNLWSLQKLKNQGKSNKTKNFQRKVINFIDSFLFGKLPKIINIPEKLTFLPSNSSPLRLSSSFFAKQGAAASLPQREMVLRSNKEVLSYESFTRSRAGGKAAASYSVTRRALDFDLKFKNLENKLFQKWKNKNKKMLYLGEQTLKIKEIKRRNTLFFLNKLKTEKNWKRAGSAAEWFNFGNRSVSASLPPLRAQRGEMPPSSNSLLRKEFLRGPYLLRKPFSLSEGVRSKQKRGPLNSSTLLPSTGGGNEEKGRFAAYKEFFSRKFYERDTSRYSYFLLLRKQEEWLYNKKWKNNQYVLVFYSFLFHFCTFISLISIYQIRSYLKFHFLIIFKSLKFSTKLMLFIFNFFNNFIKNFTTNSKIREKKKIENDSSNVSSLQITSSLQSKQEGLKLPFPANKTCLLRKEEVLQQVPYFRDFNFSKLSRTFKNKNGSKNLPRRANVIDIFMSSPLQINSYIFFEKTILPTSFVFKSLVNKKKKNTFSLKNNKIITPKGKKSYFPPPKEQNPLGSAPLEGRSKKRVPSGSAKENYVVKEKNFNSRFLLFNEFKRNFIFSALLRGEELPKGLLRYRSLPGKAKKDRKGFTPLFFSLSQRFCSFGGVRSKQNKKPKKKRAAINFARTNKFIYFKTNLLVKFFMLNFKKRKTRAFLLFYKQITKNLNKISFHLKYYKNSSLLPHFGPVGTGIEILKKQFLIPNKIILFLNESFQNKLNNIIAFLKNPFMITQDFLANIFLLEWSLDLRFLIPENVETKASKLVSIDFPTIKRNLKIIIFSLSLNNYILSKFQQNSGGIKSVADVKPWDLLTNLSHKTLSLASATPMGHREETLTGSENPLPLLSNQGASHSLLCKDSSPVFSWDNTLVEQQIKVKGVPESNLLTTTLIFSIFQKFLSSSLYSFLSVLSQPETDLIIREKRGNIYSDNWSDILTKAADKYKIIIPSLALLQDEQNKLIEKVLALPSALEGSPKGIEGQFPVLGAFPPAVLRRSKERKDKTFQHPQRGCAPLAQEVGVLQRVYLVKKEGSASKVAYEAPSDQTTFPDYLSLTVRSKQGQNLNFVQKKRKEKLMYKRVPAYFFPCPKEGTRQKMLMKPLEKGVMITGAAKQRQEFNPLSFMCSVRPSHPKGPSCAVQAQRGNRPFGFCSFFHYALQGGSLFPLGLPRRALGRVNFSESENSFINSFSETWPINQFVTSQSKDTDLFIDLHPPKNLSHISSIKYSRQIQQPLGSLICSIYSKTFVKQQSKNILIIGASTFSSFPFSRNVDSSLEKNLLISCLAGETELKVITDNAQRYSGAISNVAVGIRLLREVFDALIFHTPCLFVLQNIHLIGEKREGVFSDSSYSPEDGNLTDYFSGPGEKKQVEIQNKINTEISSHSIKHYKKPYKGEFSSAIPTNHFAFEFFRVSSSQQKDGPGSFSRKKQTIQIIKNKIKTDKGPFRLTNSQSNRKSQPPFGPAVGGTGDNEQNSKNTNPRILSRLQFFSDPLLTPPATSPLHVFALKEERKFQPKKIVKDLPLDGLSTEQQNLIADYTYSIRKKVALLADQSLENMSVKLDMITDLLMILDGVRLYRGFVVFATTDSPSVLDPALRRPGRLDETLRIPTIQNVWGRWQIFKNNNLTFSLPSTYVANLPYLPFYDLRRRARTSGLNLTLVFPCPVGKGKRSTPFPYGTGKDKGTLSGSREGAAKVSSFVLRSFPILNYEQNFQTFRWTKSKGLATYFVPTGQRSRIGRKGGLSLLRTGRDLRSTSAKKKDNSQFFKNIKKLSALNYFSVGKNLIKNKVYFLETTTTVLEQTKRSVPINRNPFLHVKSVHQSNNSFAYFVPLPFCLWRNEKRSRTLPSSEESSFGPSLEKERSQEKDIFFATIYGKSSYIKILLNKFFAGKISESFIFCKVNPILPPVAGLTSLGKKGKKKLSNFLVLPNSVPTGSFAGTSKTSLLPKEESGERMQGASINEQSRKGIIQKGARGFQILHGLDETLRTTLSLILALKTKRYMFSKNLIVPSLLTFENSEKKLPNPPESLILMPAKRYENYKRAKSFLEKKAEISINEKINLYQQKNFTTNLYNLNLSTSSASVSDSLQPKFYDHPRGQTTASAPYEVKKQDRGQKKSKILNNIFITVKKSSKSFDKISGTLYNYRSKLLTRHRQYLLNQWSFMQFPEHNSESIFLSDVDWRYTFIFSIGEFFIDYPDAEQFYKNNKNFSFPEGRLLLWDEISHISSRQYEEHFIFESFIKGFSWLNKNREFLDYSVYKNETKTLRSNRPVKKNYLLNIFKRFKVK